MGLFFAASSLLPLAIVVAFATHFAIRRDLHTVTFSVGIIANYALNIMLKHSFKELRPKPLHRDVSAQWSEYGMPSAHSQFMWFFSWYMTFFVLYRLPHEGTKRETFFKAMWLALMHTLALVVSVGRVYLHYHTTEQVFYGGLIGLITAFVWFTITQNVLTHCFAAVAGSYLGEALLIRDLTPIPNVTWFEYVNASKEAARRTRSNQRRQRRED